MTWLQCGVASWVGVFTVATLGVQHFDFAKPHLEEFRWKIFLGVAVAGVLFGLQAKIFMIIAHFVEFVYRRWITAPGLRGFLGGTLLVCLFQWEGSARYAGLGLSVIQEALQQEVGYKDSLLKMIFTVLTLGAGFKGGEFIPLVFMGATLGSALSSLLYVPVSVMAAVGFVAVFAGAARAPMACSLMAMELFGYSIAPYAIVACFASVYFAGSRSIYH